MIVFAPAVVEVSKHDPAAELSVTLQFADPSLTVTVSPLGIAPAPGALTVTLTATEYACPTTVAVERSLVMVVVVLALLTTCETAVEVLVAKFVSPA